MTPCAGPETARIGLRCTMTMLGDFPTPPEFAMIAGGGRTSSAGRSLTALPDGKLRANRKVSPKSA